MNELEQLAEKIVKDMYPHWVDSHPLRDAKVNYILAALQSVANKTERETAIRTYQDAGRAAFKWWYDEGPEWLRTWSNGGMDGFEYTKRFGVMSPGSPVIASGIREHLDAKAAALNTQEDK